MNFKTFSFNIVPLHNMPVTSNLHHASSLWRQAKPHCNVQRRLPTKPL